MAEITLVIADDHKLFRVGLKQLLDKQLEIKAVGEASNGFEAVNLARDLKPDVVLMDISMPELNGIEATRKIVSDSAEVRVIILSMHSDRRYIVEALRAGAKGYLLKDSAPDELTRAVHTVMLDQFYLSPQIGAQIIGEILRQADSETSTAFGALSAREREVLQQLAEGKSTRQIANKLNLSTKTVETHRMHIMEKLNLHTIAELTRYAIREGITPLD